MMERQRVRVTWATKKKMTTRAMMDMRTILMMMTPLTLRRRGEGRAMRRTRVVILTPTQTSLLVWAVMCEVELARVVIMARTAVTLPLPRALQIRRRSTPVEAVVSE